MGAQRRQKVPRIPRALYIARMLRNTRDFCSSDIHFAFYAFSYLELK
jgi:hypothetical protein